MRTMTTQKKLFAMLLVLLLALGLAACGGSDEADTTNNSGSSAQSSNADMDSADNGDETKSEAKAEGGTLQEKYESGDAFLTSFVKTTESQLAEQNGSCTIEGNTIIVAIAMDLASLGGNTEAATSAMDEYFADEELVSTMNTTLDTIASSAGIDDVKLTYRYTDSDGKVLYEKTFEH